MRFRGGYNVSLAGRPSDEVKQLPQPDVLHLPLFSQRFNFSALRVQDGEQVEQGQILAQDPGSYSVPLLAPRSGVVKLSASQHVTLENLQQGPGQPVDVTPELPEAAKAMGQGRKERYALLRLGAWQFFADARTGCLPDPFGAPQAVVVSTSNMEPFTASSAALLRDDVSGFGKGLEYIHSLLDGQPLYVATSSCRRAPSTKLRDALRKYSWVRRIDVPPRFPFGDAAVLAQLLGLNDSSKGCIWSVGLEGVLAAGSVLSTFKPWLSRVISVAGPGAKEPVHVAAVAGYPLKKIFELYCATSPSRIVNGGVLTGQTVGENQLGLDVECRGLTLVPEKVSRDILGFARFGVAQNSYSNAFLSALIPGFKEKSTTGIRGEARPCVSCGFCEQACPVSIMPHLVYRYANKGRVEESEKYGLSKCVGCGLCSYVCPSKIDVKKVLLEAQEVLKGELEHEEKHS